MIVAYVDKTSWSLPKHYTSVVLFDPHNGTEGSIGTILSFPFTQEETNT